MAIYIYGELSKNLDEINAVVDDLEYDIIVQRNVKDKKIPNED